MATVVGSMSYVQTRMDWDSGLSRSARLLLLLLAAWCLGLTSPIGAADREVRLLRAKAVIRFAGTSTLHDFGGQLPVQPFILVISNHMWSATADVLAGQMAT